MSDLTPAQKAQIKRLIAWGKFDEAEAQVRMYERENTQQSQQQSN